ncbi:MAG: hypothetical protein IT442_09985, partial [Phycisphaeraceae bacterium]|nr:hypothetical protein [Phycisphaeraceae bacterium]
RLGMLPLFVRLIGATIDRSQIGSPMSDAVRALVPEAAARIVHWANQWRQTVLGSKIDSAE